MTEFSFSGMAQIVLPALTKFLKNNQVSPEMVDKCLDIGSFDLPEVDAEAPEMRGKFLKQVKAKLRRALSSTAVEKLTVNQVLALALIENDHPYERAAQICACQVGTIKSRVSRARWVLNPEAMRVRVHKKK
ncbi:MAG TPA: hypothetical protein VMH91_03600 [Candidatus Paceibacterota bacterium]|nr:hypothetical protein [Candidatus Paceibacterota bacterium]